MKREEHRKSRGKPRASEHARPAGAGSAAVEGESGPPSTETIAAALEHHRAGRLVEAEAGYRAVLERDPGNPDANHLLGMLALDLGYAEDAVGLLRRAVEADAAVGAYLLSLGNALVATRQLEEAETAFRRAMALEQGIAAAPYNLGLLYLETQRTEQAVAAFGETLAIDPEHPRARFLFTALSGGHCDTAPPEYVAELFDNYAEHYDKHLRDVLHCRVPETLRQLVLEAVGTEPSGWTVLDLGCGSGACGPLFRPYAGRLVGTDLSARILDKARENGSYDELYVEDLKDTLARAAGAADLVLAADVFVYVGDLDAVFGACARALRPGGLFAFSTESLEGNGFHLLRTCRYGHSVQYIRALAARHGFGEVIAAPAVLRTQDREPVQGHVWVLRRVGPD